MRIVVELLLTQIDHFDVGSAKEVETVMEAIVAAENDAADAGLDDEFGAFDAGFVGDVECGTVGVVAAAGNLGDGVGFGVKNVGLGDVVFFADIFETGGGAVVAVGDDHLVFDDECSNLTALAVGIFSPNGRHTEVPVVEVMIVFHDGGS